MEINTPSETNENLYRVVALKERCKETLPSWLLPMKSWVSSCGSVKS